MLLKNKGQSHVWLHKWAFWVGCPSSFPSLLSSAGKTLAKRYKELVQKLQKDVDQLDSEQRGCENSSQGPVMALGVLSLVKRKLRRGIKALYLKMRLLREEEWILSIVDDTRREGWSYSWGLKEVLEQAFLNQQYLNSHLNCLGRLLHLHPVTLWIHWYSWCCYRHRCGQDVLFRSPLALFFMMILLSSLDPSLKFYKGRCMS